MIGAIIGVVIVAGAAFYGGTLYAKSSSPARGQFAAGTEAGQFARGGAGTRAIGAGAGGGFTAGEIISKDASSVTIKMQDGSSKIVVLAPSTQITKSAEGSIDDLATGTNITVTGSANSDGSVTAQMVQIRPAGFGPGATSTRQAQ
jgi:hypothetical protein